MSDTARRNWEKHLPGPPAHTKPDPADEALKHCPPSTREAARRFRQSRQPDDLRAIVNGVIERYVSPDLRERLKEPNQDLLLVEHLGLDSLTLMEIVMRLDDVFSLSVPDEELRRVRTLGEVCGLVERNLARAT